MLSKRKIRFNPFVIVGYLLTMALLVSLGNWQLRRAEQKRQLLAQKQAALLLQPVNLNQLPRPELEKLENRKVIVHGQWDADHQFLIDNQMHQGKVGYYVMTPLKIAGTNSAVLVNRGWVAMNRDRKILPDIGLAAGDVQISGRINHFPRVAYQLQGADIPTDGWPAVVQVVNPAVISKKLGYPVLNFQLEMDPSLGDGFIREWKISQKMPPEKHVAYAMQWFGLALTLTILLLWMGFKKTDE